MMNFYAKSICVQLAQEVFGKMKTRDVAMILGLAINVRNHEAFELFVEMEKGVSDIQPIMEKAFGAYKPLSETIAQGDNRDLKFESPNRPPVSAD
ncbi:hypothetical protein Fmac_008222 [Flemingia macrophylla]|uniref:Uncharacterized protein n=1 Tax=Flemingia macrophylla TaxID=520843 RepID=A0ABD1MWS8_9FABA